jgi:hypothetical protein
MDHILARLPVVGVLARAAVIPTVFLAVAGMHMMMLGPVVHMSVVGIAGRIASAPWRRSWLARSPSPARPWRASSPTAVFRRPASGKPPRTFGVNRGAGLTISQDRPSIM